jgi:hypothetical protein
VLLNFAQSVGLLQRHRQGQVLHVIMPAAANEQLRLLQQAAATLLAQTNSRPPVTAQLSMGKTIAWMMLKQLNKCDTKTNKKAVIITSHPP